MVRCDVVWKWCIQGDVASTPKPSRLGTFGAGRFVTCVYVYVYICVYAYLWACVHAYACVCVHVCVCMYVYTCLRMCMKITMNTTRLYFDDTMMII